MAHMDESVPKEFVDLMSTLEAAGFRRAYESEWITHLEKPPIRVTIDGEPGSVWSLSVAEARPNDYFAGGYLLRDWVAFLDGSETGDEPESPEAEAAVLLDHLSVIESSLRPEKAEATLAGVSSAATRRFGMWVGESGLAAYEQVVRRSEDGRRAGDRWDIRRDLHRLHDWFEVVGSASVAYPPDWVDPPHTGELHLVRSTVDRSCVACLEFAEGVLMELAVPTKAFVRPAGFHLQGFTRVTLSRGRWRLAGRWWGRSDTITREVHARDEEIRFVPAKDP